MRPGRWGRNGLKLRLGRFRGFDSIQSIPHAEGDGDLDGREVYFCWSAGDVFATGSGPSKRLWTEGVTLLDVRDGFTSGTSYELV